MQDLIFYPVGYQNVDVESGDAMVNPSFLPVAGGDILISDIKVEGSAGVGDVSMQNMLPNGDWADITYYYMTFAGTGYAEDGWYRDQWGMEPVDETDILEFGHGMSLTSNENDIKLSYSGEVKKGDPVVTWAAGDGYLGNPTPVIQYFSDLVVEGSAGVGDVSMQKMLPNGDWADTTYYYMTFAGTGYAEDGWYRDQWGMEPVDETDVLAPGEAISLTSSESDLTITFKKVLD